LIYENGHLLQMASDLGGGENVFKNFMHAASVAALL
jgi:hypothetical protein